MSIEEEGSYKGEIVGRARAIMDHTPSPYDREALTLKVIPCLVILYSIINMIYIDQSIKFLRQCLPKIMRVLLFIVQTHFNLG